MNAREKRFACDASGYIRHWVIAGPHTTPYDGPSGSDDFMRRHAADETIVEPPADVALGAPGPFGGPWAYYSPGENIFVERSGFYTHLETLDMYAATDVHAPADTEVHALLWASGTADLWVNGAHVCRHDIPRYMRPEATPVGLLLKQGVNRLCVRLQGLGVRDTRFLFGIRVRDAPSDLTISILGRPEVTPELTAKLVEAERWLQGVKASGRDTLRAEGPAPFAGSVRLPKSSLTWPAGESRVSFDPDGVTSLVLGLEVEGQGLRRTFDFPANRRIATSLAASLAEHRREYMRHVAAREGGGRSGAMQVLARRSLGERQESDTEIIAEACRTVEARGDCADFVLAALLRLYAVGDLADEDRGFIKKAALGFRYWSDEPGADAMCFGSENHSLLFHGCQLVAGRLFAGERFSNSDRSAEEQADVGRRRSVAWLGSVEPVGFREFLSSTYMPLTTAALMNLVDFSGDEGVSRRAAALVDRIFNQLAMHSFDGVTTGPQGRVYRNVLYPDSSGTQAMLSYAAPAAAVAHSDWLSFVATSQNYEPPGGVNDLMRRPVSRTYGQADVEIRLEKTEDYALSSLQIPASFAVSRPGASQDYAGLFPGEPGYQQHLWHATLSRDCHVFVSHPGATFDLSSARPGYWYGNGVLPRTVQRGGILLQIFDIPEGHPIRFTHAHWPAEAFDRQELRDHWAFGAKGRGRIALWCSERLESHSEVLTDRELRAWGSPVAWMCVCAGEGDASDFDDFVERCLGTEPLFDREGMTLHLRDSRGLEYAGRRVRVPPR